MALLDERNIAQQNFMRILTAPGLPTIRLYDLRHTAATNALLADVPVKVVSEMLGPASVAFTLDVYAHVLPHMQDQAATKVEVLLFKPLKRVRLRLRQAVGITGGEAD